MALKSPKDAYPFPPSQPPPLDEIPELSVPKSIQAEFPAATEQGRSEASLPEHEGSSAWALRPIWHSLTSLQYSPFTPFWKTDSNLAFLGHLPNIFRLC